MELAMRRSLPSMSENQKRKRKRITPTTVAKYQPAAVGLQRYLKLRGTPSGVYEISRTVTADIRVGQDGWTDGITSTKNITWVFSPQYLKLYRDSATLFGTYNVPNAAEISALWDDIKLESVELTFTGIFSQYAINTTAAYSTPRQVLYGTDDNDAVCTTDGVKQLGDCKVWYPNNASSSSILRMRIKPKYNTLIYYTAVTSGYKPERGYVRSDYDIDHYGLKMALIDHINTGDNSYGTMQVAAKFNFRCKNLK